MTKLNPASLTSSTDLSVTAQTEILELYLKKVVLAGNVLPPNTVSTVRLDALGGGDFAVRLETVVATGSWVSFSLFCSNTGLTDHVLTKGIFFPFGDKDIQIAEWNTGFEELNVFIQLAKARLEELNFLPVTPAPKWTDVIANARDALKRFLTERVTLTLRKEESGFFQFPLNEFILDVVGNYEGFEFKLKHEKKILLEGTSAQGKSYTFKRVDTDIEGIDLLLMQVTNHMDFLTARPCAMLVPADDPAPSLISNVDLNDEWVEHYRSLNPGVSYATAAAQGLNLINKEIEIAKAVLAKYNFKN